MRLSLRNPPREFSVGLRGSITIQDLGEVELNPDEQLTFVTESGSRYDFVRKSWGYYVSSSINSRLAQQGIRTALVQNGVGRLYLMAVEASKLADFESYCEDEGQRVLQWF